MYRLAETIAYTAGDALDPHAWREAVDSFGDPSAPRLP
jgi:hypothetical protein